MNLKLQHLVDDLYHENKTILATILCCTDHDTWKENKEILISRDPLLSLEMALHKIPDYEPNTIPTPDLILQTLQNKQMEDDIFVQQTYMKMVVNG